MSEPTAIKTLKPQLVWGYFAKICTIPRPSKHEQKISAYVAAEGKKLGLKTEVDKVGNVIIYKPATAGHENCKTIILQSHLDMVPEKTAGSTHNFSTDSIAAYIDKGWVSAKDTTLGADNGIGIATILAILANNSLKHGPITAVFTVDEETDFTGVNALVTENKLTGDTLISLDSEEEGTIFIGSAGGTKLTAILPLKFNPTPNHTTAFTITISGLQGGHSGNDIHRGRGNANKILARILWEAMQQFELHLTNFNGGKAFNAIPRDATATILIPNSSILTFAKFIKKIAAKIVSEFKETDPKCAITLKESSTTNSVIATEIQHIIINTLHHCPTGVDSFSKKLSGATETSLSLGVITTEQNSISAQILLRGIDHTKLDNLAKKIAAQFTAATWQVTESGNFFLWEPNFDSPILKLMQKVYKTRFGKEPIVTAAHCGLECGLFSKIIPDLDIISIGPTIENAHSPAERLEIASVAKFWELLTAVLEQY